MQCANEHVEPCTINILTLKPKIHESEIVSYNPDPDHLRGYPRFGFISSCISKYSSKSGLYIYSFEMLYHTNKYSNIHSIQTHEPIAIPPYHPPEARVIIIK